MNLISKASPVQISAFLHMAVGVCILFFSLDLFKTTKKINFTVIENPVVAPANLILQPKSEAPKKSPPDPTTEASRKVFGLSRKTMITKSPEANSAAVKSGNTLAKEMDTLQLKDADADSIPIPADDYLVTTGAKLISTVVANRTDEARKAGYTGTAVLLILIDREGLVREVKLLNQLDFGLDQKAIEIAKQLRFSPARIKDDPVATRLRFSINFKSSN